LTEFFKVNAAETVAKSEKAMQNQILQLREEKTKLKSQVNE